MILDHLAVAGATLEEAVAHTEDALGITFGPGGQHARYGTHNRLIGLADGLYLEAIAIDPEAQPQELPRWFNLDQFAGPARLNNWILRSEDLEAEKPLLPPHAQRHVQMQRGDLRWLMTVPADGLLPYDNLFPAVLQWQAEPPAAKLPQSNCRLTRLILSHPEASDLQTALDRILNDPRLKVEQGAPAMMAEFDTPHGPRVLR
ncbi:MULTISPECIES: VOC family protein [unclassified Leisingera]|uniref:VOC family protein n=1 Tax=unclassified Leisingera TaxID=2614906 RepID=UPI000306C78C|nr:MULTISPECIES: VOC family protein [unclassified Leisingera]KIC25703.1 polyphosphate kinase [Leisingera sp. ANG-S3]KIC54193.1 polyphosphate kinase [Leisingera sp. ANG-S]KID10986.1 polyphosphate kinase [Leisingera sp. ANG1]